MSTPAIQTFTPTPASTDPTGPRERPISSLEHAARAINELITYVRMLTRKVGNVTLANPIVGPLHSEKAGDLDARYIYVLAPSTPDEEFEVAHFLGRAPMGYEVCGLFGKPGMFYASGSLGAAGWDDTVIRLKCTVSNGAALIRVF